MPLSLQWLDILKVYGKCLLKFVVTNPLYVQAVGAVFVCFGTDSFDGYVGSNWMSQQSYRRDDLYVQASLRHGVGATTNKQQQE